MWISMMRTSHITKVYLLIHKLLIHISLMIILGIIWYHRIIGRLVSHNIRILILAYDTLSSSTSDVRLSQIIGTLHI